MAAIEDCDEALALRAGSTDPAWKRLETVVAALDGWLAWLELPATAPHHPVSTRRAPRAPRFLRAASG